MTVFVNITSSWGWIGWLRFSTFILVTEQIPSIRKQWISLKKSVICINKANQSLKTPTERLTKACQPPATLICYACVQEWKAPQGRWAFTVSYIEWLLRERVNCMRCFCLCFAIQAKRIRMMLRWKSLKHFPQLKKLPWWRQEFTGMMMPQKAKDLWFYHTSFQGLCTHHPALPRQWSLCTSL